MQPGGAGPASDPPSTGSAALVLGSTWFQTHSKLLLPSLLLKILTTPTPGPKYLSPPPAPSYTLCVSLSSPVLGSLCHPKCPFSPPLTMKPESEVSYFRKAERDICDSVPGTWCPALSISVGYKFTVPLTIQGNRLRVTAPAPDIQQAQLQGDTKPGHFPPLCLQGLVPLLELGKLEKSWSQAPGMGHV